MQARGSQARAWNRTLPLSEFPRIFSIFPLPMGHFLQNTIFKNVVTHNKIKKNMVLISIRHGYHFNGDRGTHLLGGGLDMVIKEEAV